MELRVGKAVICCSCCWLSLKSPRLVRHFVDRLRMMPCTVEVAPTLKLWTLIRAVAEDGPGRLAAFGHAAVLRRCAATSRRARARLHPFIHCSWLPHIVKVILIRSSSDRLNMIFSLLASRKQPTHYLIRICFNLNLHLKMLFMYN